MPLRKSPLRTPGLLVARYGVGLRGKGARKTLRTNPKCATESASYIETLRLRIHFRIDGRQGRIGPVFCVRRHWDSTLDRAKRGARPRSYRGAAGEATCLGTKPECALE